MNDLAVMVQYCQFTQGTLHPINASTALPFSPTYESIGGYLREDAIMILRQFYMTENTKGMLLSTNSAPKPKAKARRVLKTEIYRTYLSRLYFVTTAPGVSMHGYGLRPDDTSTGASHQAQFE